MKTKMKRLSLIAILFAATMLAAAQSNTVTYLSFSPEDRGLGFRVDIDGGYMSMQYGNYKLPYGGYIKDHTKIAMGIVYKSYSLGLAYHRSGETKIPENVSLTKATLRPISVEAGVRIFVNDWFVSALRYDILRHEGTIEFGVRLYNAK
jgi:hypothetical protein